MADPSFGQDDGFQKFSTTTADPSGAQDGFQRSIESIRPSHYVFKIKSFSLLAKHNVERFETEEFQAGLHKWKLVIHPNGNKNKNIDDHVSLYLMIVDESSFTPGWEVYATFRFFIHDQINDNYLVIEDPKKGGRRFYELKLEWGVDRLISLETFKNKSNGYLINDTCAFGVEVICRQQVTGKGECLSMMNSIGYKHTWKINNFSTLAEYQESTTFTAGDQKWKISMYPKGLGSGAGNSVSVYLNSADTTILASGSRIFAEFTLCILDQIGEEHKSSKTTRWFTALEPDWGWAKLISMNDMKSGSKGYVNNNSCTVEAEVTVLGVTKAR